MHDNFYCEREFTFDKSLDLAQKLYFSKYDIFNLKKHIIKHYFYFLLYLIKFLLLSYVKVLQLIEKDISLSCNMTFFKYKI